MPARAGRRAWYTRVVGITPDTKDWTWVVDERCPECGFLGRDVEVARLGDLIRLLCPPWVAVLERDGAAGRTTEDRWSTLEYACHVRDVFRRYDQRLRLMLDEHDPTFPNWDQDVTAVEDDYAGQDPTTVATDLVDAAERLAHSFDAVRGEQWQRTGLRSDGAHFTVESFGRYFVHDPIHHLVDVGVEPPSLPNRPQTPSAG